MPIYESDAKKLLRETQLALVDSMKAHFDLLDRIFDESDWAYVIKSHALLEAVTTQAILAQVGDERIKKVIERLPLSDDEAGKIAIGKELGILTKEQRRFIREFSALRNSVAHRIENIDFSFTTHFEKLDSNQKKAFIDSVLWSQMEAGVRANWVKAATKDPKLTFHMFLFMLVSMLSISASQAVGNRKIDKLALETAEALFKSTKEEKK